jgi:hypothetical protein
MGNMRHNGRQGYLDDEFALEDGGKTNIEVTVDAVARLVSQVDTQQISTVR